MDHKQNLITSFITTHYCVFGNGIFSSSFSFSLPINNTEFTLDLTLMTQHYAVTSQRCTESPSDAIINAQGIAAYQKDYKLLIFPPD